MPLHEDDISPYLVAQLADAWKYSEDQPRDEAGRFGSGGGGGDGKPDVGSKENPLKTGDPNEAVKALGEGKYVQFDQPRTVSVALDKIKAIVDDARAKGEKAPNYDLCKATVEGTSLFCAESKGIPRIKMPQLSGKPTPGSWADKNLPKDDKGSVDLTQSFVEHLSALGISTTPDRVPADVLKASQNELDGGKVAGMASAIENGTMKEGSIFTTKDDYVVDGHHRWAATVGAEYKVGQRLDIPVQRINTDILTALRIANDFTEARGLAHAAVHDNLTTGKSLPWVKDKIKQLQDDFVDVGCGCH